jgi:DDE superfamily endonuclease
VVGQTVPRHTSAAFVEFLTDVVAGAPRAREIHVILDNLSTHNLHDHLKVRLHFTPTSSPWLNQVELWFSKIERPPDPGHLHVRPRPRPSHSHVHPALQQGAEADPMELSQSGSSY